MCSPEEEKLIQMVRDFIESGSAISPSPPPHEEPPQNPQTPAISSTLMDILSKLTDDEAEILEKILLYTRDVQITSDEETKKWIVQRLVKDGLEASLCRTSWVATFGRPSGDYEYIDVVKKVSNGGEAVVRLIVDMDFRSQFELARPTPAYSELLNLLPCTFVGSEEKLMKTVSLLCSAAKQSLKERGLLIPPWRKASYVQSKWLSENCKKITFSSA
ncbi:uncharacterized protein LOC127800313 isoform X2 [Diospyros lotus]|uniref:uncharacterized protein LOC127800313 isoform X2 n=1 Tax=Diospyros lotus TaxID=55363 RepID=UPI00224CBFD6|nr:uncharacterized protein LOC127800313 isoform X2 [Diospyros lotus]